jgi:hypothetical protein
LFHFLKNVYKNKKMNSSDSSPLPGSIMARGHRGYPNVALNLARLEQASIRRKKKREERGRSVFDPGDKRSNIVRRPILPPRAREEEEKLEAVDRPQRRNLFNAANESRARVMSRSRSKGLADLDDEYEELRERSPSELRAELMETGIIENRPSFAVRRVEHKPYVSQNLDQKNYKEKNNFPRGRQNSTLNRQIKEEVRETNRRLSQNRQNLDQRDENNPINLEAEENKKDLEIDPNEIQGIMAAPPQQAQARARVLRDLIRTRSQALADSAAFNVNRARVDIEAIPDFTLGAYNNTIPNYRGTLMEEVKEDPNALLFLGKPATSNTQWFTKENNYPAYIQSSPLFKMMNKPSTQMANFDANFYSANGNFYLAGYNKPINKALLAGLKIGSAANALLQVSGGNPSRGHQAMAHYKAANFLKKLKDAYTAYKSLSKELNHARRPSAGSVKSLVLSATSKLKPNNANPRGVTREQMMKGISASNALKANFAADANIQRTVTDVAEVKAQKNASSKRKRATKLGLTEEELALYQNYYSKKRNAMSKAGGATIGYYGTQMDQWQSGRITTNILDGPALAEQGAVTESMRTALGITADPNMSGYANRAFVKEERADEVLGLGGIMDRLLRPENALMEERGGGANG